MGPEKKTQYKGREVFARSIDFDSKGEAWSQYTLEDGSTIKMKVILLDVKRVIDEYSEDGNPVYQVSAQYVMGIDAPDNLKKKAT